MQFVNYENALAGAIAAALIVILLTFADAAADESPAEGAYAARICKEEDLAGTYVLVDFRETPPVEEAQWTQEFPYQYLRFSSKETYDSFTTNQQVASADKIKAYLSSPETRISDKYLLDKEGVLTLYSRGKISYSYRCVISLNNAKAYQKGDIILTGYAPKSNAELYKLYRRWF